MPSQQELVNQLNEAGQTEMAQYLAVCEEGIAQKLADQLQQVDLKEISELAGEQDAEESPRDYTKLQPPKAVRLKDLDDPSKIAEAKAIGEKLLSEGKVAALLVAGGQGSRLGFEHPKGMFPVGPVSGKTLFQIHLEKIVARSRRYGKAIPLYLMTSPATHEETIEFLDKHDRFGMAQEDLHIFCQGTMPAIDKETKQLLLAEPDQLALSPDGHGGMLAALVKSGCLEDMTQRGIEQIYYFQVDNPLADVCEPEFLGLHHQADSEMSTQVVAKKLPEEKLGILAELDGQLQLVEYSELPAEQAAEKIDDGTLKHWAGNIAVHGVKTSFLQRMSTLAGSLPWHKAIKKIAYVSPAGDTVSTESPNAIKFERFIFDLLPQAQKPMVVEVDPALRFAPVKNADGAPSDTPQAAKEALCAMHRSWLEACGVSCAADRQVEISPLTALDADELKEKLQANPQLAEADYIND
ncbi:UTP--glucose-1-phosphate uridylyltransferase [Bremerella sp. T1]|uniref:UTP--glucose-1-phosphate uridylyltransferase n=1 Tax=Bremerella sp. TYQ1 TaxID=3119568 RepID=UPI001CCFBD31|nr:UDPGP type 1 family protein [Bremerella volcania]UBM38585.1 UDPGP type 1 family protein [Bremerella volcania]